MRKNDGSVSEESAISMKGNDQRTGSKEAKELFASPKYPSSGVSVDGIHIGEVELCFLNPDDVEKQLHRRLTHSDVIMATEGKSDLLPQIYEGGLKIWECSLDLVHYLHDQGIIFSSKRVLELGCGIGLPGIYAAMRGAKQVHFQDYNDEVINHMTIPSIMLNIHGGSTTNPELRFFAGDWNLVQEMLLSSDQNMRYDIILTSETIYSVESYDKLYKILRALLSPVGIIYLAAKTHYFGVGGGTRLFEEMVKRYNEFSTEVCKTFCEGVKREILKMKFLNSKPNLKPD